jgi:hypothetical protein
MQQTLVRFIRPVQADRLQNATQKRSAKMQCKNAVQKCSAKMHCKNAVQKLQKRSDKTAVQKRTCKRTLLRINVLDALCDAA